MSAQVVSRLPAGIIHTSAEVSSVAPGEVRLTNGETLRAGAIVVASDGPSAHRLLGARVPDPGSRAAACCWFALASPPLAGPHLILDGSGEGPALNVVVMSEVQPGYAPAGRALIAAAVPGPAAFAPNLADSVHAQLSRWFGLAPAELELLRTDVIAHGQPAQPPPLDPRRRVDSARGCSSAATTATPRPCRARCLAG